MQRLILNSLFHRIRNTSHFIVIINSIVYEEEKCDFFTSPIIQLKVTTSHN